MEVLASDERVSQSLSDILNQRQLVEFHPSVWGDYFIEMASAVDTESESRIEQRVKELIEEVRLMLINTSNPLNKLQLIDVIQRLGISYHFKVEIDDAMSQLNQAPIDSDDLHVVALQFRLLRQNRHNASSSVLNKFKDDKEVTFKASLSGDAKGLLSLYEAAYFGIPGEDILDEAIGFTKPLLKSMVDNLEPTLKAMVSSALEVPMARKTRRLEAREYIFIYQDDEELRNDRVLELAKLDYHLVQLIYQKELRDISLWWKELDLPRKLGYPRDRLVECYFFGCGTYYEPQCSRERELSTKLYILFSMCDDTYDTFGKPDELDKFDELIRRWDAEAVGECPEYLRPLYLAILDFFKGVEDELVQLGKDSCVHYARESIKEMIHSYWEESTWRDRGYVPTLEEYLRVSRVSSTYPAVTCVCCVGLGGGATKEVFEWIYSNPRILKATSAMGRIYNDLVSHQFERQRIHVASSVECYMKEHGVSSPEAHEKLKEMIEREWRIVNQHYLQLSEMPTSVIMPVVNLAQVSLAVYRQMDTYTNSATIMKDAIDLLCGKLIPI